MTASVRVLGSRRIECDGISTPLRGNKAWALLAYLLLAERPPSRRHLTSLLFPEAEDPLRALRWNLSELRRALRGVATVDGDPVVLDPVAGCDIDVRRLTAGQAGHALSLTGSGHELLEGLSIPDSPAFEAWLAAERCRIAVCAETVVIEQALDLLAAGEPGAAARLAARAVAMNPLEADHHAVLVRSLTAAGDRQGARRQADRCADLFRRELGCAPPAEVVALARAPIVLRRGPAATPASAATTRSYLDAGHASLDSGAVARALDQLQCAVAVASEVGDPLLRATACVALAGARVHGAGERGTAVRGLLHEAAVLARQAGAGDVAAAACRELAFLTLQRGPSERALVWLDRGLQLTDDDGERARLLGVRGMCLSDGAHYTGALAALDASASSARKVADGRQEAWSLSMSGRLHVVRGDHSRAAAVLDRALGQVSGLGWTGFLPWPESFRAEAAIGLGDLDTGRALLDHAWVLATESDDHCWIAAVAHGQAVLAVAEGDWLRGRHWCDQGLAPAPWYLWPYARLLDIACAIGFRAGSTATAAGIDRLEDVAARGGMRDLVVHAQLHRARAGSPTALATAGALAAGIDDPALQRRIRDWTPTPR
ncbi:BTAD domain-containing putative transcriptional regulator [Candidatus Blastococcus massiliensis]|uniref:BTAD domain-containing putative transcriptional regulator n=1 Tax=Candidatus Blastococcus massiliensis TaxID=1470358 RepID=UPI0004B0A2DE|nr:BTAD domain-containing putative transcriptional regulator [Candidatus Blastococcus massiliensis]